MTLIYKFHLLQIGKEDKISRLSKHLNHCFIYQDETFQNTFKNFTIFSVGTVHMLRGAGKDTRYGVEWVVPKQLITKITLFWIRINYNYNYFSPWLGN